MSTSGKNEDKKEKNSKKDKKDEKRSHIVTRESLSAVCALFSAFALFILFTGNLIFGSFGANMTEVMLGTFGYFSYPIFIAVLLLSVSAFMGKKLIKNKMRAVTFVMTVFFVGLIVQTAMTGWLWTTEDYLANCFVAGGSYATATVCGVFGGLFVWAVSALVSPVGAIIVFSLLTLLNGYLFFLQLKKKGVEGEEETSKPAKKFSLFRRKKDIDEGDGDVADDGDDGDEGDVPPARLGEQPKTTDLYQVPRPAVNLPSTQDPWARQASYSPFSASQDATDKAREESRAILFGGSPAESYSKNLFFDRSANVNNRPMASQAPMPSYTQAYEQSLQQESARAPEKIVTDYTRPAPSYVHPAQEERRDEGLLRDTSALRPSESSSASAVAFDGREGLGRLSQDDGIRDDFRRDDTLLSRDFGRTSTSAEPVLPTREDRITRDASELFDRKEDRLFEDTSRMGSRDDAFVSPFAERDFRDDNADFMQKEEEKESFTRDTFIVEDKPTDRFSASESVGRTSRFVQPTPAPQPKEEPVVAPPPIEKPKYIRPYSPPPLHYFNCTEVKPDCSQDEVEWNKKMILATLEGFGIKEATISSVTYGPTVTRYNIVTPINVASKKIIGLAEQFAVNLHAEHGVNVSFNYGDGATSIEVPNRKRQFVHLGAMLTGAGFVSAKQNSLTFTLGVDVSNEKVYGDIAKMTHVLVAGASGMGKSAFLRSLIISLIYKYSPQDLRLILIDPKMADFTLYTGIPHLVINEIICRPQQAVQSLRWAIGEMERRYELFRRKSLAGTYVVNLDGYNANLGEGEEKLPKIVIIVDELADLMSVARKDVEDCIQRLTAKARAAGIHMILATQRPSVDVVTGVIKSNLPTRIACAVSSEIDSRVILDTGGAEKLLGIGDMMYSMAGFKNPIRVQAPYIEDAPAQAIINYIRDNNDSDFNSEATSYINNASAPTGSVGGSSSSGDVEPVYIEALKYAIQTGSASISMLQRKCSVGFNKAGKIIEWMEEMHYIAEFDGSPKPRKTLLTKEEFEEKYGEF